MGSTRKRKKTELESLSREELLARHRLVSRRKRSDGWFGLAYVAVKWGVIAYCAHQGQLAIRDLAGKETIATIGLRLDVAISYAVAAGAAIVAWRERKLRRDTVQKLQGRITEFERQADPSRSSSGLTKRGETRREDA